jgi:hypothetical protein
MDAFSAKSVEYLRIGLNYRSESHLSTEHRLKLFRNWASAVWQWFLNTRLINFQIFPQH